MRVEIWGSQVHVVDLVAGSLLLIVAGFLLWSVWAIRRKGFRRYWGGVSKASVATMAGLIAVIGAVLQMLGAVASAVRSRPDDAEDDILHDGLGVRRPGQLPHTPVLGKTEDDDWP